MKTGVLPVFLIHLIKYLIKNLFEIFKRLIYKQKQIKNKQKTITKKLDNDFI